MVLGLAYPLVMTGVAQVVFPGAADGAKIERDGKVVGSKLIGQEFPRRREGPEEPGADPRYFQSRPSATGYSADVTFFNNLGPEQHRTRRHSSRKARRPTSSCEGPTTPGLTAADVPVDAVTTSASGVDPHISEANARIQAHRVAAVRGLPLARVAELIDEHTDGRSLGFLGEPGVNVLELNLALDQEALDDRPIATALALRRRRSCGRRSSPSLRKLDPREQVRNPVMFVVEIGAVFTTVGWLIQVFGGDPSAAATSRPGSPFTVAIWLWLTVVFANFAEALAEGRGKAQADALRAMRTETIARAARRRHQARVRAASAATSSSSRPARRSPATAP